MVEERFLREAEGLDVEGEAAVEDRGELLLKVEGGDVGSDTNAVARGVEDLRSAGAAAVEDGRDVDHGDTAE
ncbi:hypothetical protein [Streptosporangium sp. NPDC006930]|uniref:hypothetical protein n=1 Tax=Streptosporangium sp. NPDC006930 TaxID=3154783 RepID=UPI003424855C